MDNDCKTLGPADGNVEAIWIKQKLCTARRLRTLRGRHGNYDNSGLLPLKFIHSAELGHLSAATA